jgi:pre-mRNA-splicing factor RBM22/SLT11
MRYKRTEICQTCAKLKNICQSCALDLDLRKRFRTSDLVDLIVTSLPKGLPIQYRDHALGMKDPIGKHDRNKEYFVRNAEAMMVKNDGNASIAQFGKVGPIGREVLKRVTKMEPYQTRARPQICPFYLKSQCSRGAECPFRYVHCVCVCVCVCVKIKLH